MILALDLGTTTGFALGDGNGKPVSGVKTFSAGRFSGGGMRFLRFRGFLEDTAPAAEQVVFEAVRRHNGTDAAHVYGGFLAVLTAFCEERKIPYEGVPVQTIKKFATGKGNASKSEVIAAVSSWGYRPVDDNEADALALLQCVLLSQVL